MKRIVAAWIEQILEFDTKLESMAFVEEMKRKPYKFTVVSSEQAESGIVTVIVRKQYNNNEFPDNV